MYEDIIKKKLNRIADETKEIIKERNKEIIEISSYINKKNM